jgi:hypothetical protein
LHHHIQSLVLQGSAGRMNVEEQAPQTSSKQPLS